MKTKLFKIFLIIFILIGLTIPVVNFLAGDIHGGGIDLGISSPTENFIPLETTLNLKPGNSVNREIEFLNRANNPFNLFFDIEKVSGDDDFCNSLQLEYEFFYQPYPDTGPIRLSDTCGIPDRNLMNCNAGFGTILPGGKGNLFFTLKLPKDVPASLQNRTCQFNFVFLAQQILPQPCLGPECPESENMIFALFSPNIALAYFSDTEIITNTIKSGQWEEILPQKMVKPVAGWLVQRFDFAEDSGYQGHEGIDIDSQIEGRAVVAAADGTVVYVQREIISGAGLWVWIWHGAITDRENNKTEKISTRYLHLKEIPLEIQPGAAVYGGKTIIGKVSNTGDSLWQWRFSPHLHFEVRQGSSAEDIISGKTSYSSTIPLNSLRFVEYDDRSKKANSLTIFAYSPVDLVVIDPDGFIVSKEVNSLPLSAWYFEMPIDEEGMPGYEFIAIDERKLGDYLIKVIPEVEALPTDTYTLEVLGENGNVVVAEAVRIAEIPLNPYILRLTETGIIPIIPAVVNFDPDILNLRSRGQWVTVYLELPVGKEVSEINLASIRLNKQIPIEPEPVEMGDYDRNGLPDLMIKFNREAIRNILEVGDKVKITISGELTDGRLFEGNDTIKVIK